MVTADDKAVRCLQDLKNVYNLKSVGIADEITIEFQLRSLLSDEEAQIPTQNVQYPREIDFKDSDLYTDDPEEAYCEGNTSQNVSGGAVGRDIGCVVTLLAIVASVVGFVIIKRH